MGEWDWAVGILDQVLATELEVVDRFPLTSVLLTIRALRGEVTETELDAHESSLEGNADRQMGVGKLTPRLQADLAGGRWDDFEERCLELLSLDRLGGTAHLFLAGRVGLRCDAAALRRVVDRHEGLRVHGQAISVERVAMRAGLAALEGRTTDAHAGYQDVLDSWRELGLEWDEAMTGLEMATVLNRSEPDVAAAIDRSVDIFERLRARPFLERLTPSDGAAGTIVPGAISSDRGQRDTEPPTRLTGVRPAAGRVSYPSTKGSTTGRSHDVGFPGGHVRRGR